MDLVTVRKEKLGTTLDLRPIESKMMPKNGPWDVSFGSKSVHQVPYQKEQQSVPYK